MFDNYDPQTGIAEAESAGEKREIDTFLESVMSSDVFGTLKGFIQKHGKYRRAERVPQFLPVLDLGIGATILPELVPKIEENSNRCSIQGGLKLE